MELFEFSQYKELVAVIVGTIVTVLYAYTTKRFLLLSRRRKAALGFRLREAISHGLKSGTLTSVDDFVNIYKGVYGLGADDVSYRAGLAKALRQYIVEIVSDEELEPAAAVRLKDAATDILSRIEAESPFAEVPAAERNLLLDVSRFARSNDHASVIRKLEDLAGLIEVRQDSLERVQASNKWSIPLATIGLILTVVFGVISLLK